MKKKAFIYIISFYTISALRSAYSDISCQYLVLLFSDLFFHYDYANATESFLLNYFIISILYRKISDLLLKVNFEMICYYYFFVFKCYNYVFFIRCSFSLLLRTLHHGRLHGEVHFMLLLNHFRFHTRQCYFCKLLLVPFYRHHLILS